MHSRLQFWSQNIRQPGQKRAVAVISGIVPVGLVAGLFRCCCGQVSGVDEGELAGRAAQVTAGLILMEMTAAMKAAEGAGSRIYLLPAPTRSFNNFRHSFDPFNYEI